MANIPRFLMSSLLHLYALARKARYSKKAVMEEVDRLPAELDWTYHNASERIFTQDKADAQLAMQILRWVCLCLEPLRLSQLQGAIAVERGYLANDPDCCKGVDVNYGGTDAPVPLCIASE
jgi:hypothetical protein